MKSEAGEGMSSTQNALQGSVTPAPTFSGVRVTNTNENRFGESRFVSSAAATYSRL